VEHEEPEEYEDLLEDYSHFAPPAEGEVLVLRQMLVTEEDHQILGERTLQLVDIRHHAEPALGVGVGERIGFDRRTFRHHGCRAGREVQQGLGSLSRQVIGDLEQGVLGWPAGPHRAIRSARHNRGAYRRRSR